MEDINSMIKTAVDNINKTFNESLEGDVISYEELMELYEGSMEYGNE